MAAKKNGTQSRGYRWLLEAAAVLLAAAGVLLGLSLGSFHPTDPSWGVEAPGTEVRNIIGPLGAQLAWSFYEVLGFSSWLLPPLLASFGALVLLGHKVRAHLLKILGASLSLVCVSGILELVFDEGVSLRDGTVRAGGFLGEAVAEFLAQGLHATGAGLVLGTGLLLGLLFVTQTSLLAAILMVGSAFASLASAVQSGVKRLATGLAEQWNAARQAHAERRRRRKEAAAERRRRRQEKRAARKAAAEAKASRRRETAPAGSEDDAPKRKRRPKPRRPKPGRPTDGPVLVPPTEEQAPSASSGKAPVRLGEDGGYRLPPIQILDQPARGQEIDEETLMHNAQVIVAKYAEFSIEGKVLQIHPGPVVTTYEFKPEAGVKYSKITGLSEDLALALKAQSVRIDRIPGKSTVGIEVPNADRQVIHLSEVLASDVYEGSESKLTLALGKTIEGDPYVADLAKMPHLLIAGSTGSGKSVSLNSMIASILFRTTPQEVRFILIDPKRLELGLYRDLPHLYTPVVTDPKRAVNALQWAVHEMEDRYRRLAEASVRNIDQYNRHLARRKPSEIEEDEEEEQPLPYIVIVVDELADLMLVTKGGVEEALARLAQMARAVGIHLILATQRPSVDVLTGVIKANFPSRVSFRVSSRVDSRTVLDANGAEQLLGKGDLLFLPPGSARLVRLHAPLLTESEIADLTDFWKDQADPDYREDVVEPPAPPERELEEVEDELYDQAARIVVDRQEASVSYLQRRLRIGYARAARLVDLMELDGLVGPSPETGGKMREVIVPADYFKEVDQAQQA